MWQSILPVLKGASALVGVVAFTGVVYAVMTLGPPSSDPNFNYSTVDTTPATRSTPIPEGTFSPRTPIVPTLAPETRIRISTTGGSGFIRTCDADAVVTISDDNKVIEVGRL